jgi:hypothetical protein
MTEVPREVPRETTLQFMLRDNPGLLRSVSLRAFQNLARVFEKLVRDSEKLVCAMWLSIIAHERPL